MSDYSENQDPIDAPYTLVQVLQSHAWGRSELCEPAELPESDPKVTVKPKDVLRRVDPAKMVISAEALKLAWGRLAALWHPYLLPIKDFSIHENEAYTVRDYFEALPLRKGLQGQSLNEVLLVFYQLLEVIEYLHGNNILLDWFSTQHLANNLWVNLDPQTQKLHLKVSDFGWNQSLNFGLAKANQTPLEFQNLGEKLPGRFHPYWDLRAVGTLLYEIFTQQTLTLMPSLKEVPGLPTLAKQHPYLEEFLRGLLSFKSGQAFAHASGAKQALKALLFKITPDTEIKNNLEKFSSWDESQLVESKFYLKYLKQVMLQGGHWAFIGPEASGKPSWARWLQRYLWRNGHEAWLLRGEDLFQFSLNFWEQASPAAFWIIDEADTGPVADWLAQSPKPHVIILGHKLTWVQDTWQNKMSWQQITMPELGKVGFDLRQVFANLSSIQQEVLCFLMVTQIPESLAQLSYVLGLEKNTQVTKAIQEALYQAVAAGLLQRCLWQTQEYFKASFSFSDQKIENISFPKTKFVHCAQYLKEQEAWEALHRWLVWVWSPQNWKVEQFLEQEEVSLWWAQSLLELGNTSQVRALLKKDLVTKFSPQGKARSFYLLARSLEEKQFDQAKKALEQAAHAYQKIENVLGLIEVHLALADFSDAKQKHLESALNLTEKLSESFVASLLKGKVYFAIAKFYQEATDWERAETYLQQSVEHFWAAEYPAGIAQSYASLAEVLLFQGKVESVSGYMQEAIELALLWNNFSTRAHVYLAEATIAQLQQREKDALQAWNKLTWLYRTAFDQPNFLKAMLRQSYLLEEQRQFELVEHKLKKIESKKEQLKSTDLMGLAHLVRGKLLLRDSKKSAQAFKSFAEARASFSQHSNSKLSLEFVGECALEQAELAYAREEFDQAREHWKFAQEAMEKYRRSLSPYLQQILLTSTQEERLQALGREVG